MTTTKSSLTERPTPGTRLLYRDGGGRLRECHAGSPAHDTPGGEWVWVAFRTGAVGGTWVAPRDLYPYDAAEVGRFAPASR